MSPSAAMCFTDVFLNVVGQQQKSVAQMKKLNWVQDRRSGGNLLLFFYDADMQAWNKWLVLFKYCWNAVVKMLDTHLLLAFFHFHLALQNVFVVAESIFWYKLICFVYFKLCLFLHLILTPATFQTVSIHHVDNCAMMSFHQFASVATLANCFWFVVPSAVAPFVSGALWNDHKNKAAKPSRTHLCSRVWMPLISQHSLKPLREIRVERKLKHQHPQLCGDALIPKMFH